MTEISYSNFQSSLSEAAIKLIYNRTGEREPSVAPYLTIIGKSIEPRTPESIDTAKRGKGGRNLDGGKNAFFIAGNYVLLRS